MNTLEKTKLSVNIYDSNEINEISSNISDKVNKEFDIVANGIDSIVNTGNVTGLIKDTLVFTDTSIGYSEDPESVSWKIANLSVAHLKGACLEKIDDGSSVNLSNLCHTTEHGTFRDTLFDVDFPNVKYVGDFAFTRCRNLSSARLDNCEVIGKTSGNSRSFYMTGFRRVSFPNLGIINGPYAFGGGDKSSYLEYISIPKLTYAGSKIFLQQNNLRVVDLSNRPVGMSLPNVSNDIFSGITDLTKISVIINDEMAEGLRTLWSTQPNLQNVNILSASEPYAIELKEKYRDIPKPTPQIKAPEWYSKFNELSGIIGNIETEINNI